MLGVLCPGQGRIKMERRDILGLPVLWVYVPLGGYWEKYRLARAERLLLRQGVRRLLPLRDAPGWKLSLPEADPLPLYRAIADRIVLAVLKRGGKEPCCATVALAGKQVDADLARTAQLLCPCVRTLLLEVGYGGERLARELYWEFGAVAVTSGQADVHVRFSGAPKIGELVLCGRPELLGLELELPGICLPEQLEPAPVLSALWQAGRIHATDLFLWDENGAVSQ